MATYRDRPPSFSYGGGGSGRGSIAELIYASGQDRANATMQQGDILANTIAGVGQDIGAGIQANQQAKALKARTEAFNNLFAGDQPPDPNSILKVLGPKDGMEVIKGLNALHPQASYKDRMEQFRDVARGVQAVPEQARPAAYDTAVKSLTANGVLKPGEAPETYDPNFLTQVASYGQAPKEKTIQTATVPGPNGPMLKSVTPEELAAGVPTYVAPKEPGRLPAEEAYIKAKFGDNPTPQQMLQGRAQFASAGREPKGGEDDTKRKQLVAAVVSNPALYDRLTPTEVGQIAGDLHAQGFDFGKALPEKAIGKISESKSAVDSLRDLRAVLQKNEQYIGPIAGLQAMNPYSDARKAQADIDLVRQRVGKALEGGVLRKEDEEKYKKILATLRDEPSTAIYKVDNIIKNLENDLGNYINEQKMAGRRVNTGTENRPGKAAPAKGARRTIGGKLAEWDGKGWMAVQ